MDKNLNNLLKWSIEHTAPSTGPTAVTSTDNDTPSAPAATTTPSNPAPSLDPAMLAALLGGPSDADLMKAAMEVITDETSSDLENKLIAFDNFEQLIESLDNANNLEPLALWTPLINLLSHSESELRRMAAWCVGTAVQNNARSQERLLAMGGIAPLVGLATAEAEEAAVRRKAIYALSSAVRNYQPAMDVAVEELKNKGQDHGKGDKVDAADMDAVDGVIGWLKQRVTDAKKE